MRGMMWRLKQVHDDDAGIIVGTGTANAHVAVTKNVFAAYVSGITFTFKPVASNTAASTMNANAVGIKAIRKYNALGADVALVGGELQIGSPASVLYDSTANSAAGAFILLNPMSDAQTFSADIASATTTDLSPTIGISVNITGTTTITGFGTLPAGRIRVLTFASALILTHNGTSLQLPGATNITTVSGDVAIMQSLGGGNWKCISYLTYAARPYATGTYTPGWFGSVTDPVIGNGTISGKWTRNGNLVKVRIYILMGSTTTYGSGSWIFGLPSGLASIDTLSTGYVRGNDNGVASRTGLVFMTTTQLFSIITDGSSNPWSPTVPQTWNATDSLVIEMEYFV